MYDGIQMQMHGLSNKKNTYSFLHYVLVQSLLTPMSFHSRQLSHLYSTTGIIPLEIKCLRVLHDITA